MNRKKKEKPAPIKTVEFITERDTAQIIIEKGRRVGINLMEIPPRPIIQSESLSIKSKPEEQIFKKEKTNQMKTGAIQPVMVNAAAAASMLGISRSLFYKLYKSGNIGARSVRLGGRVLWRLDEMSNWVKRGCPAGDFQRQVQFDCDLHGFGAVPIIKLAVTVNGLGLPKASGIYFVWDGNRVVYVGQSQCLRLRATLKHEHIKATDCVSFIEIERQYLFWAECYFIGICRPVRNHRAPGDNKNNV